MSVKTSANSRIKTIRVCCDRFKHIVEGIRGEKFTSGFYDMTKWEEYRREKEQYVCESCMFADPKYVERYGSLLLSLKYSLPVACSPENHIPFRTEKQGVQSLLILKSSIRSDPNS